MKNVLALFLILCILSFGLFFENTTVSENVNGKATFVAELQDNYPICANVIESGNKSYVTADLKYFKNLQNNLDKIHAVSLEFEDLTCDKFIKEYNVQVLKTETIDNKSVTYGYSSKFNNHIFIDNKMVNVQIVQGESLKVGIPAILDCF